jgi:very-short-patch-repair endonuclease
LRHLMTRAETLFWRYIKAGHLNGLAFRRQAPIGRYIVDFVCHSARLIVEIDGGSHDFAERIERDRIRDHWLMSRGFHVLRFTNADVLKNLEGVVIAIRENAGARIADAPPSLSLPRKGGGNARTAATQRDKSRGHADGATS